jgi:hypothetical protein
MLSSNSKKKEGSNTKKISPQELPSHVLSSNKAATRSPSSKYIGSFIKDVNMSPSRLLKYKSFLKRIRANKIKKFFRQNLVKTYYTHEKRIKYYQYLVKHLTVLKVNECLAPKQIIVNGKMIFDGYSIHDKIFLDKQIGTASKHGVIYKTFIKDTFGGAPIATKIMKAIKSNKKEIDITIFISDKMMQNQLSRHFLFTYKYFQCVKTESLPTDSTAIPRQSASTNIPYASIETFIKSRYFVTLNEMAHGDLKMLCNNTDILKDDELLLNLSCQCMIALAYFHNLNYVHRDAHWGNFLYHKTDDNKSKRLQYYHYIIYDKHYYLTACGYTIMLHDFGKAEYVPTKQNELIKEGKRHNEIETYDIDESIKDYTRILKAFMIQSAGGWINKYMQYDTVSDISEDIYYNLKLKGSRKQFAGIREIIIYIMEQYIYITKEYEYNNIITDIEIADQDIINKEPFVIR